jgi:ketosteroid isomerase-like protein
MFATDATLAFPATANWSPGQFRNHPGCAALLQPSGTARARSVPPAVAHGIQMEVDDILVNGPPWNTRAAARVRDWMVDADGEEIYANRAVLFVTARWGKIQSQEDYEDTTRVAAFDALAASQSR